MSTLAGRRISEDLRYELVDAARVAETSNRPRSLLVLATILFLIAGVALIVTLRQRQAGMDRFRVQSERKETVIGLQHQFEAVARRQLSGNAQVNDPLPNLFSLIEQSATEAGLRDKPPIPDPQSRREAGGIRFQYNYTMRDPSLEALLAWVQAARRLVPGLEVSSVEIVPTAKEWQFKVSFVRWERPA